MTDRCLMVLADGCRRYVPKTHIVVDYPKPADAGLGSIRIGVMLRCELPQSGNHSSDQRLVHFRIKSRKKGIECIQRQPHANRTAPVIT